MEFQRLDYFTGDRSMQFDFVFMHCDDGWRAYIINEIDYGYKDDSGQATHRNHFPGDTYKHICWNTRLNTLDEAKAVASAWADITALYLRTNLSFDELAGQYLAADAQ